MINLFKRKTKYDVHPRYDKPIEFAFEVDGVDYYKLASDGDVYQERATYMIQFAKEMDMKLTKEILKEFLEKGKKLLDEGKLGQCYGLLDELSYRNEWLYEPTSLYRMASVVFFDIKENIKTYDEKLNEKKIALFKKKDLVGYLLEQLMYGYNPFSKMSLDDSQTYLSKLQEALKSQESLLSTPNDIKQDNLKSKQTTESDKTVT